MTAAEMIRDMRGRGYTLARIAEEIGVAERTVWRWAHGKGKPIPALACILETLHRRTTKTTAHTGGA